MNFPKRDKLGTEQPLEVSQFIEFLNEVLKSIKARVIGEVAGMKVDSNGHVWFSLRDKRNGNTLGCVIWKHNYRICGVQLKEGLEVIISGSCDIYPARGSFNFKVDTVELVGEGALKKAYDELKEKLSQEGLFAPEKKRPIPEYPQRICVITSLRSGTVIHDFTSNLGKFGFKIKAIDSRVEGQEAVKGLLDSMKIAKKEKMDILVIIRGGGSLESLMAFDNEILVREIASFPVPVVAGIGHHKDITLVSLAADASESTPTAVAQLLNNSWERAIHKVKIEESSIFRKFDSMLYSLKDNLRFNLDLMTRFFALIFKRYQSTEKRMIKGMAKMEYSILGIRKSLSDSNQSLARLFSERIEDAKMTLLRPWVSAVEQGFIPLKERAIERIYSFEKIISQNDPERQLKLGYGIVRFRGGVIKSVDGIKEGDSLEITVSDGAIDSEIKKITPKR